MHKPLRTIPPRHQAGPLLWQATDPDSPLAAAVMAFCKLDGHGVRVHWRKAFRREPPEGLGRLLLIRILAWREQAKVHGDLDPECRRVLDALFRQELQDRQARGAGRARAAPDEASEGSHASDNARVSERVDATKRQRQYRPGTILLREYDGEVHQVRVIEGGFLWRDTRFASLSGVARRITGTNWNGPRFFGMREGASPRHPARWDNPGRGANSGRNRGGEGGS